MYQSKQLANDTVHSMIDLIVETYGLYETVTHGNETRRWTGVVEQGKVKYPVQITFYTEPWPTLSDWVNIAVAKDKVGHFPCSNRMHIGYGGMIELHGCFTMPERVEQCRQGRIGTAIKGWDLTGMVWTMMPIAPVGRQCMGRDRTNFRTLDPVATAIKFFQEEFDKVLVAKKKPIKMNDGIFDWNLAVEGWCRTWIELDIDTMLEKMDKIFSDLTPMYYFRTFRLGDYIEYAFDNRKMEDDLRKTRHERGLDKEDHEGNEPMMLSDLVFEMYGQEACDFLLELY